MAETKNVKKKGRPAKQADVKVENECAECKVPQEDNKEIDKLYDLIAQLKKELDDAKNNQKIIVTNNGSSKKVKCISLAHNMVNISTEPYGRGKSYTFNKYGDVKHIKWDDLQDIVSCYPNTINSGLIAICDNDFIEEMCDVNNTYTKEEIDKIVKLENREDLDALLNMNDVLYNTTAYEIARLYKDGIVKDLNSLEELKEKKNIDIIELSKNII